MGGFVFWSHRSKKDIFDEAVVTLHKVITSNKAYEIELEKLRKHIKDLIKISE